MHPELSFGPFANSWKLIVGVACALTLPVMLYEARYRGLPARLVLRVWPCVLLGGFLGAHLYFILTHPRYLDSHPVRDFLDIFTGLSVQGCVIGGVGAVVLMLRLVDRPALPFLDMMAPAVALSQAIGRLGCLAAGCCYGKPFSLGVVYTDPLALAPLGVPLHPTQVYESVLCALLAWRLHSELKKPGQPPGRVLAFYLLGYAGIRFFVQFLRDDDAGHLVLGLAHSQYMAGAMALAGAWLLRRLRRAPEASG